ncbi:MAG TPA: hypothetical protein VHP11_09580 [Tepidisphaeraceae bacterium]|nr:hypothetical protein [Tepidisphaeraceae bacterium]
MASLLEKLGDNQAILLMYLAEELPPQERAQVDQMLAADPSLRAELDQLLALQDFVAETLDGAETPIDIRSEEAAIRRVVREMRRHQVELLTRPIDLPAQTRRWPRWAYSAAAAAAVVFMLIGLWGIGAFDLQPLPGNLAPSQAVVTNDVLDSVAIQLEEKWLTDSDERALDLAAQHAAELKRVSSDEDPLLLMI